MNRLIVFLLCGVLLLTLVGCNDNVDGVEQVEYKRFERVDDDTYYIGDIGHYVFVDNVTSLIYLVSISDSGGLSALYADETGRIMTLSEYKQTRKK